MKGSPPPDWRHTAIVAWTGMRGVVSLAAALALPLTVASGEAFPGRDLILFHTFAVILVTLVLQGLSLPWLIQWLGVVDDGAEHKEEHWARVKAVQAALKRLDEFRGKAQEEVLERLRSELERKLCELESTATITDTSIDKPRAMTYDDLTVESLAAARRMILQLRNERTINDEVLRRIQYDLDLVELRLRKS
jgi:CPA1 family monovalent cation:H+ antiporter